MSKVGLRALPVDAPPAPPADPGDLPPDQPTGGPSYVSPDSDGPPDRPSPLEAIHQSTLGVEPDHAASVLDLSSKLNASPAFVDKNLPAIKNVVAQPDSSFFKQLETQYPGTTQFLTDPKNMAVSRDDIPNLTQHESLIQDATHAHGLLQAAKAGFQGSATGMLARQSAPDTTLGPDSTFAERMAAGASSMISDLPEMIVGGAVGGVAGAAAGTTAGAAAGSTVPLFGTAVGGAIGGAVGTAAGSSAGGFAFPAALKQALLDHFQKGDVNGMADVWDRAYGMAREATKQGLVGLVTAGAGGLASATIGGAVAPLAAEVGAMGTAGPLVEGERPTASGYLENALLVGGLHAATGAGSYAADKFLGRKAEASKEFYDNMGNAIQESKLNQRLPDTHRDMLASLTDGTPVENIYIAPDKLETYLQSQKIDPATAIEQLGATKAFAEAKATGTKVEIPYADFANKMVNSGHYKALADDITFNQDDLSNNEITARRDEVKAQTQAAADQAASAPVAGEETPAASVDPAESPIRTELAAQLKAAGLTAKEVKYDPELHEAFFNALGKSMGMDPAELARQFPLEVRSGGEPAAAGALNQSERPNAPEFYSKLAQTVEQKMGGSATPEQINGMLREIKPEERKWSGLDDFLQGKEKVSKQDLLEHLRGNQLDIQEVKKLDPDASMEEWRAAGNEGMRTSDSDARFPQYTLPGGENYREKLFTLPGKAGGEASFQDYLASKGLADKFLDMSDAEVRKVEKEWKNQQAVTANAEAYRSSHFSEPNVLAHTRLNDRVDSEGKKVLFAEEIQSDWHQEGRKKGYKGEEQSLPAGHTFEENPNKEHAAKHPDMSWFVKNDKGEIAGMGESKEAALRDLLKVENRGSVPDAPFKKTWHEFVLKKLLREAAEKGYDKLAWTTGEQQADRYSLAKQVDAVYASKNEDGTYKVRASNGAHTVSQESSLPESRLSELLGKDLAEKIIAGGSGETKKYSGVDLKVGGEGMKGFYDKIIPDALNKIGKKFGAKVGESIINPNGVPEFGGKAKVHSIEITPAMRESVLKEGQPLFQGEETPRGQITLTGGRAVIDLFKGADRSTFLHESGHYFLDVMGKVAAMDNAPDYVKEDHATLLKWFGVDKTSDIGIEQHEQFARGFEAYLREGVAPSEGLRKAFYHFKSWLTALYQHVAGLRVELSPEVRGVMDRMLATRDQIEQAQKSIGQHQLPDIPGLDPKIQAKLMDFQERARDAAEGELLKKQMGEITEKNQQFLTEERARLTDEATKTVGEAPIFQAIDEIKRGVNKFTNDRYKSPGYLAEKLLSEKLGTSDAAKFEALAEVHGFDSGEELAQSIVQATETDAFKTLVDAHIEQGMAPHAALMDTQAIRDEALKAVHNEHQTELLALEHSALMGMVRKATTSAEVTRRNRAEARVDAEAAKAQARDILADKPIKDSGTAGPYMTAERNAAARAAKFLTSGDFEKAADAKRQQMLNHALAAEAIRNKAEAAKAVKYLSDFAGRGRDLKEMPYGFVRQVDQLLSRFGLADPRGEDTATLTKVAQDMATAGEDPGEIANATGYRLNSQGQWVQETLPDFVTRVNDNYYALSLPDTAMSGAQKPYEDLRLSELRDVRDSVKAVADVGKKFNRYLGDFEKMDIKAAAGDFRARIESTMGKPFAPDFLPGSQHASKFAENLQALRRLPIFFDRWLDTVLTTCHKMDGLEEGPAKDNIYRPFEKAEAAKQARTADVMKQVDAIFAKHYTTDEFAKYKDTRITVDGRVFTKEEILSMALNRGNEGNLQRLKSGFGFDDAKLDQMFSHLGKKDWDFAQDTWDHLHEYWPDITKLEMDVNGVEPKGVQPSAFTNEHGTYRGGYYPIAYDFEKSIDAYKSAEEKTALYKQYSTARAQTDQGHTEARVSNVTRSLRLSLDVLRDHHHDVIHDLEFRRPVIDVSRFLNQKDARTSISNAVGLEGYGALTDWVKAVAGGGGEPLSFLDQAAQWFRFKSTFFTLGYRLASIPKIAMENFVNVASEVGVPGAARAIKDYYLGQSGMHDMVIGNSEFMRERAKHLTREISDIHDKWQGTAQSSFRKFAFWTHAAMDQAISFPLWADTYRRSLLEHGSESKASLIADETIKRTFQSGGAVDQAAVMRGGEKQRALTTAYGYSSMMWNRFSLQKFDASQQWAQGNHTVACAVAARAMVYQFLLPGAVAGLSYALIHNGQTTTDEDEDKAIMGKMLDEGTPLKFMPVLRDVAPYFIQKAMGAHTASIHFTPLEEAAQTLIDPMAEAIHALGGKPMNDHFPEQAANAVSLMTGVPKELNDLTFNFLDWQQKNGALTWRDAISRRTKK